VGQYGRKEVQYSGTGGQWDGGDGGEVKSGSEG
jgi:hypothetical protein